MGLQGPKPETLNPKLLERLRRFSVALGGLESFGGTSEAACRLLSHEMLEPARSLLAKPQ